MRVAGDPRGYYRTLGVPRTASVDQVRLAFRERAKVLHPDQGGPMADEEGFRRLREAYEVLRDPRKRLQYDAEGLASDRGAGGGGRGGGANALVALFSGALSRRLMPYLAASLAMLVVVLSAVLWSSRGQLEERDRLLAENQVRLDEALREQAEMRARYRGANFMRLDAALQRFDQDQESGSNGFVFNAELDFPPGLSELNDDLQRQLDENVLRLADVIGSIPEGRDFVILIEGQAGEAARDGSVAVAAWETTLLRLGVVVDRLVSQGLPDDRLAVRFQAGFAPEARSEQQGGTVELKLLCCFR